MLKASPRRTQETLRPIQPQSQKAATTPDHFVRDTVTRSLAKTGIEIRGNKFRCRCGYWFPFEWGSTSQEDFRIALSIQEHVVDCARTPFCETCKRHIVLPLNLRKEELNALWVAHKVRDDSDAAEFNEAASRIRCNACDGWISVDGSDLRRTLEVWQSHKKKCPQSDLLATPFTPSFQEPTPRPASAIVPESMVLQPGIAKNSQPSRLIVAQRQRMATLMNDPCIRPGSVEASRVFCLICNQWVRLRDDSTYCINPWNAHREKCIKRQYVFFSFLLVFLDVLS